MAKAATFTVQILSPLAVEWEGDVTSLHSENSEGPFSIMPDHARFMTLLKAVPVTLEPVTGEAVEFTIETGVLFFADNLAKVYKQELQEVTFPQ